MTFDSQFYKNLSTIDPQTLIEAAEGGVTIAIAASLYYSFFGLILGMSGLVGKVISGYFDYQTRRAFTIICGLIFSSTMVFYMYKQQLSTFYPFDSVKLGSNVQLIAAGFLVGIGTQLGSGCTSGHGLCGLPRLSLRSIVAVMVFLITGIITATFNINELFPDNIQIQSIQLPLNVDPMHFMIATTVLPLIFYALANHKTFGKFFRTIVYFFIGAIFGFGLMLAGMSQRTKIYGFLQLNKHWDPSLFVVLMSGVFINLIIFSIMRKAIKKPIFQQKLSDVRGRIDWKLLIGACLFGLGWGIGGLCPGPYLLLIPLSDLRVPVLWGVPFLIGMKLIQLFNRWSEQGKAKVKSN